MAPPDRGLAEHDAERPFEWLPGGGEMGERIRTLDWASTPVGPIEAWPRSLMTAVRIILGSRYPMFIWWGREMTHFYNDAYAPILGKRHPEALGQPAFEVWDDIWDVVGPLAEAVLDEGQATWNEDLLLVMERNGYPEETYFTFSYSPAANDAGGTGGVFCACIEETTRVVGERRLKTLRELAARTANAQTVDDACRFSIEAISANPYDVPFALVYLADGAGRARLAAATGLEPGDPAAPTEIDLEGGAEGGRSWPLGPVVDIGEPVTLSDLASRFGDLPGGPWPEPCHTALMVPVAQSGDRVPAGVLIAGVSPRRQFDDAYRGFLELVAGQVATAVASASAYEQERRRAEALADLDRAKTAFFSNISHEFRTPLTLMLGPMEELLARADGSIESDVRRQLDVIHRNGARLLKLVNTLLDFSRIEAKRVDARYEPTDLATLTADLASVFRSAVERAGLSLVVDCLPLPEPVYVDRDMWEKIVFNLLSNAVKYTLEGRIEVALRPAGDSAELTVRDTGIGIADKELPRLFERFHRVEGARGRTHEGSGIGLALVQELVKLHGGSVGVESEVDRGSAFFVSIPFGSAHLPADRLDNPRPHATDAATYVEEALRWLPPPVAATALERPGAGGAVEALPERGAPAAASPLILLADDNADLREYMRQLLEPRYDLVTVADGAAALEAVRERVPDLVLTDVMMPRLDGFELLKALRSDERTATIPVIMLSARAGEESRVEGLEAGADDYLVKPFSARELLARIESNLKLERLRREAEAAVRQRTLQFETLVDNAPLGVYHVDADFRIRQVNPTALPVFGDIPDLVGRDFDEVIHILWPKADADELAGLFRHTLETGEPYAVAEWAKERGDRETTEYYEWQINRIMLPEGRYGVVCYFRDISVQVHARQAIAELLEREQAARAHADEANRVKDEFLATISHELRTPLNSILGWTRLLQAGHLDEETAARAIETIQRNTVSQAKLIEDVLDVSRIVTGRLRLSIQPVDLETVVKAAVDSNRPAADAKGIHVDVALDEHAGVLLGDPERLQQVVWNLVSNAVKFTGRDGAVRVRLARIDHHLELSVSDTGRGIEPEFLRHVFDRFQQADSGTTRRYGGLGLGLAIVRHIVELHGGSVSVESSGVGHGATFRVRLPLAIAQSRVDEPVASRGGPSSEPPALDDLPSLAGLRLLVVDDEADARDLLVHVLARRGAEARLASSAREALAILDRQDGWVPDALISDVGMPEEDGYALIRAVRAHPSADVRHVPALALTAYARAEDRNRALASGFERHIAKPVEPAELVVTVADLASRRGRG